MNEASESQTRPGSGYWVVGGAALVWNLVGVFAYLMQVTMTPEALAELSDAERELITSVPTWATGANAVAVFAGVLGALGLLLRRRWSELLFAVSVVAILVQMVHAIFFTDMLAVRGPTSALLPVLIILVGVFLVWYSAAARKQGWLR